MLKKCDGQTDERTNEQTDLCIELRYAQQIKKLPKLRQRASIMESFRYFRIFKGLQSENSYCYATSVSNRTC